LIRDEKNEGRSAELRNQNGALALVYHDPPKGEAEMSPDLGLWIGLIALVLAVPLGVAGNLLTPRVAAYLENRKLIKTRKTRAQALQTYNRIRAFREARRDKYAYYFVVASFGLLCAIASSTIIIAVLLTSPTFDLALILLFIAFILAMLAVVASRVSMKQQGNSNGLITTRGSSRSGGGR
jgi:hypothetical protein